VSIVLRVRFRPGAIFLSGALVLIGVVALTGCTIDHSPAVADLKTDISQMPGVQSVEHEYEAGSVLENGYLSVQVAMRPDASDPQVLSVIDTTYDKFTTTYRREQANLVVRRGPTEIAVHTGTGDGFEDLLTGGATADIEDVLRVARYALDAPRAGEQMQADMVIEDDNQDALIAELRLNLSAGSSDDEIVPRLRQLAKARTRPKGADFWVLSADGGGVGGSRGLPTAGDVAIWRELSSFPMADTIKVEFGPLQMYSDLSSHGFANVTIRATRAPSKPQLTAMKNAHIATLAKRSKKYVYNVTVNGKDAMWLQGQSHISAGQ
jgi:hypothetical protein